MSSTERTYIVDGMSCGHCKVSVTEEIEEIGGVHEVEVDLQTRRVTVRGEQVDDAAVRAAVEESVYRGAA